MTIQDLSVKCAKLRAWENRGFVLLVVDALIMLFVIPPLLKYSMGSPVAKVLAGGFIILATFGAVFWFLFAGIRFRNQLGLRCPHCSQLLNRITCQKTIA